MKITCVWDKKIQAAQKSIKNKIKICCNRSVQR